METEERTNEEKKASGAWPGMFWCGSEAERGQPADGYKGVWAKCDCSSMMGRCAAMCRWFPLVPVILGIACLVLGYYLDASITRILWMFVAGSFVLLGTLGLILAARMCRTVR